MLWRSPWLGLWLLLAAPGCGGIAEGGSRDRGAEGPASTGDEEPGDEEPGARAPTEGGTELGECELGPRETYAEACPWVADERCYTSREMACNCVCPRNHDSQCVSGFEAGPNGHVWVDCS